ncbi:MAG: translation initiation factor IF-3 [Acetilactobacillus jinshanensis]
MIDQNGKQVGIKNTKAALAMAEDANLDLVLVAPKAKPPVARIMNYGKFRFQQQKKAKKARKRQRTVRMKEIRLSPTIDTNDFNTKKNQAKRFLHKGAKVRVSIWFKGRAITHKGIGRDVLNKMYDGLKDVAKLTQRPKMDGRNMFLMLAPVDMKKKQ